MKKLILSVVMFTIVFSGSQAFAEKWQLYFKAQQEVIATVDGEDVLGYKLGPDNIIVQTSQVVDILQVASYHCILYLTDNTTIASQVRDWEEFMGFGYTDMIWRIALTMSDMTLNDIKYLTGAHWYLDGEWHFGSIKDWEAIDPLPPDVWFGPLREILGVPSQ